MIENMKNLFFCNSVIEGDMVSFAEAYLLSARQGEGGGKVLEYPVYMHYDISYLISHVYVKKYLSVIRNVFKPYYYPKKKDKISPAWALFSSPNGPEKSYIFWCYLSNNGRL